MRTATRQLPALSESDKARFWSKVNKNGPLPDQLNPHYTGLDQCWIWTGYSHLGYGNIQIKGECFLSHRVSSVMAHGEVLPSAPFVLHRCDNTSCVNPNHLFRGTYADNNKDRDIKGRARVAKGNDHYSKTRPLFGSKNNKAKLSEDAVIKMREIRRSGASLLYLSELFKISVPVVSTICSRKAWTHVP